MINQIQHLQPLQPLFEEQKPEETGKAGAPTFLDVFRSLIGETVAAQDQMAKDRIDLMLGDVDDLERIQSNLYKAQTTVEVLTAVKNTVFEAYNEIMKMSI